MLIVFQGEKGVETAMGSLEELNPSIRAGHDYDFPKKSNGSESTRYGYCYAFHLIRGGKGDISVGSKKFSVKKGDLIYVPPGVLHSFYSNPEQPLSSCNIYCELWEPHPAAAHQHLVWDESQFDPALLTELKRDTPIDLIPFVLPLQHHETLAALFQHVVYHHQRTDPLSGLITSHLLRAFLLELIQLAEAPLLTDVRIKADLGSN